MIFTRLVATLCIIAFLLNLSGCSDPDKKKIEHYQKALEYVKSDNDKAAILEFKNAIQLDAKFTDARYQLGLLYLKTGNAKSAFGELQRAFSLNPENLDAGVKVAEFYLLSHKREDSRKYVEQVLSVDANYLDALALLANLELIEGNFEKATEAIDKALIQAPKIDKFYNIKGRILIAQDKWDESEIIFKKAIDLNPGNFSNYSSLLMLYEQKKDAPAIQALLDIMVPKFPNNPQLHLMLANLYQKNDEIDKAEIEMLKVVEIQKKSVPSELMLSDFYKRQQLPAKAEETLKSSLTDFPDNIQLQVALADLSFDLQKFEQARAIIDKVLATNPANGGANLIKARFLIKQGQNVKAIELITPLTIDYPKWAEPFFYSALTQLKLGKSDLALKAIQHALQNDTTNDRYHALAAQIYLVRGDSTLSKQEASLALRINHRNSIAVKLFAKSLVQAKEYNNAIEFINKLNPKAVAGDIELLSSLGIAYLGQDNKEKAKQTFAEIMVLAPDNSKALAFLTALTCWQRCPSSNQFC